ncbi:hypothetical protein PR048_009976 [Dryococelus australis]|uniref:Uncharacterized protein n=1 Tax=Dryococelus australis TaxID=614101 RepID=A0ABQ9I1U1_9NEOP|nr:hypothetical protein PR048_009976 [Dryococelus australis]
MGHDETAPDIQHNSSNDHRSPATKKHSKRTIPRHRHTFSNFEVSMKQRRNEEAGRREIPQKTHRPAVSPGKIAVSENPGTTLPDRVNKRQLVRKISLSAITFRRRRVCISTLAQSGLSLVVPLLNQQWCQLLANFWLVWHPVVKHKWAICVSLHGQGSTSALRQRTEVRTTTVLDSVSLQSFFQPEHSPRHLPHLSPVLSSSSFSALQSDIMMTATTSTRNCDLAGFLADLPFPPPVHSGVAPCSPRFALIGSLQAPMLRANQIAPLHWKQVIPTTLGVVKSCDANNWVVFHSQRRMVGILDRNLVHKMEEEVVCAIDHNIKSARQYCTYSRHPNKESDQPEPCRGVVEPERAERHPGHCFLLPFYLPITVASKFLVWWRVCSTSFQSFEARFVVVTLFVTAPEILSRAPMAGISIGRNSPISLIPFSLEPLEAL